MHAGLVLDSRLYLCICVENGSLKPCKWMGYIGGALPGQGPPLKVRPLDGNLKNVGFFQEVGPLHCTKQSTSNTQHSTLNVQGSGVLLHLKIER
jgi:hypothetical protein